MAVRGVAAGDKGTDRGECISGDAAGPRQIPQRGHHILIAEHRVHATGHVCQLAEEVAAAVVPEVVKQPLLRIARFIFDGGIQRQFGGIGQVEADPAVVSRQRAGPGPEDLTGGHELIQHGGLVVGHPACQDQRLPGRSRYRHAGKLVDRGDNTVQPAEGGLPAPGARGADMLPGRQEAPIRGGVHRLHFRAQYCQRTTAELAEHVSVAPFAGGGLLFPVDPGLLFVLPGGRHFRRGSVGPELAFHHTAVRGEPLQRSAHHCDAKPQPGRGFRRGEGPVCAGVPGNEVAQGVCHGFDEGKGNAHGQRNADGVTQPGGILDGGIVLGPADVDFDGTVGTQQCGQVRRGQGGVDLR